MRIIGGELGGRRIPGPKSGATRPTSERVREAVASALMARQCIQQARVLDLFAGTGALGFEALSRGAQTATMVERSRSVAGALNKSAAALGVADRVQVRILDVFHSQCAARLANVGPFDLIFADPPYDEASRLPEALDSLASVFDASAIVVVEHRSRDSIDWSGRLLAPESTYRYGDTAVTFLSCLPPGVVADGRHVGGGDEQ